MSCLTFYIDNDNGLTLEGLVDAANEPVNDAVVEATLYDESGVELSGQAWPLTLSYVLGSDGNYSGTIDDAVVAEDRQTGTVEIIATRGALRFEQTLDFVFVLRRDDASLLTSRIELEDMFGVANVTQWADLENEGDTATISRRIQWAVREATDEARARLAGSVALDGCFTDGPLRMAVTRLAGVQLYESRGVKDTTDEEGRHRLKWHRDRATTYFQQVQAGQIRVRGTRTKSYPATVIEVEDEEDTW